jgi:hypothetical protein
MVGTILVWAVVSILALVWLYVAAFLITRGYISARQVEGPPIKSKRRPSNDDWSDD